MKRGYKPFVLIRHENEASKSLYKKLGFEKEFEMARIVFTPFDCVAEGEVAEQETKIGDDVNEHEVNGKANGNHVNGKSIENGVNSKHDV